MISYDPLWKTMEEKKVSSYMLIEKFGFYKATIQRLRKNQSVNVDWMIFVRFWDAGSKISWKSGWNRRSLWRGRFGGRCSVLRTKKVAPDIGNRYPERSFFLYPVY